MKKKGFMRVVLALLMSMLLIVSTGCGKSGNGGSSSGKKSGKTATLADMNEIPEDGIITKEQFKTVAGDNKKVQFFIKPEKRQVTSDHKDLGPSKILSKIEVKFKGKRITQEFDEE